MIELKLRRLDEPIIYVLLPDVLCLEDIFFALYTGSYSEISFIATVSRVDLNVR